MGHTRLELAEGLLPDNLQDIQDALTRFVGLPVLFLDPVGHPLAACEDLSSFCRHLTRGVALDRPCLACGRQVTPPDPLGLELESTLAPPAAHRCPLGYADLAVPIHCEGELEAVLLTAQVCVVEEGCACPETTPALPEEEWLEAVRAYPTRTQAELEAIGLGLVAVAETAGALIGARRRSLRLAERVRQQTRWIQEHARTDTLTGLANRRSFLESLEREIARAARYQRELSVALLDLKDFREVNAEYGHDTGDAMLRAVARCLAAHLRSTDLVARIGGDEFAIVFTETARTEAMIALARLESRIADLNDSGELPAEVRLATGVLDLATFGQDGLLTAFAIRPRAGVR